LAEFLLYPLAAEMFAPLTDFLTGYSQANSQAHFHVFSAFSEGEIEFFNAFLAAFDCGKACVPLQSKFLR
jgi:hypothetical protein